MLAAGHSANYERGAIGRVATYEDILWIFRMFGLEESHSQQNKFSLDNLGFALLNHDGATTLWIWLPVNLLNLYTSQLAILA